MAQSETGTMDAVAAHLEAAVGALPPLTGDAPLGIRLRLELARCLVTTGRPDAARHLADTILDMKADHFGAHMIRVDAETEAGNTDRALSAIEAARPHFRTGAEYLRKKLTVLRRGGRHGDTVPVLEDLHGMEPRDATLLVELGRMHTTSGNPAAARETFLRALTIDGASARAWLGLIDAVTRLGGPTEARDCAEQALAALPTDPAIVEKVAGARIAAGRHDDARALLEDAIAGSEAPPAPLRLALASAHRKLGAFDAAEEQHAAVLAQDPRNTRAWMSRILGAMEQGDVDLALEACSGAMAACPDRPEFARQRADVLRRAGSHRDAVASLEGLHREHPDDRSIALSLATALRQAGRTDEADDLYERILRDDPDNWPALQGRVAIAEARGDLDSALKLLEGEPSAAQ